MDRRGWLEIGRKLLGAYFAVFGLAELSSALFNLMHVGFRARADEGLAYVSFQLARDDAYRLLTQAVVYVAAGTMLMLWTDPRGPRSTGTDDRGPGPADPESRDQTDKGQ